MTLRTPVSPNVEPMTEDSLLVAMGVYDGITSLHKFGRNPLIGTSDPVVDVWNSVGLYTGFASVPETAQVFSSDAADTSAGTGARTVRLYGLRDSTSTSYTTEDVVLNATTAVDTVNTWWRINRVKVMTAGSSTINAGTITVRQKTTTANVFAKLPIGKGQTSICAWTVPAKSTFYLKGLNVHLSRLSGQAGSAEVGVQIKNANATDPSWNIIYDINATDGSSEIVNYSVARPVEAGWDIVMRVFDVSDNISTITGSLEGYIVDNTVHF